MVCLEKMQGHIALELRPGWVVVHATGIGVDDLVSVGRLLGVIVD